MGLLLQLLTCTMKRFLTILLLLTITIAQAQKTMYVSAPSGLKLRKTASPTGEVIKTLACGFKLVTVADTAQKVAHKTKEAEDFYLDGYWQKVVAGNDTGYVFDGFLIPFKPFTYAEYMDYDKEIARKGKQPELHLLERAFGKGGPVFDIEKYTGADTAYVIDKTNPFHQKRYKQTFDNGNVLYEFSAFNNEPEEEDLPGYNRITFTGYSINAVYAIVFGYTFLGNDELPIKVSYKDNTITIEPVSDGGGCYSTLKIKDGKIVWKILCWGC